MAETKFIPIACTPKRLSDSQIIEAAERAAQENGANRPAIHRFGAIGLEPTAMKIALLTTKYWRVTNLKLNVFFMGNPPKALRKKILSHANAWFAKTPTPAFVETTNQLQSHIRVALTPGEGHWSYLGTDNLSIPLHEPTMNLDGFTTATPTSEFHRVVRHEFGHALGCPHEHMRKALVDRIDPKRAILYFARTQGWSASETRAQVLTPISEVSLVVGSTADENSIMTYQLPASITKDGKPILGGTDITNVDAALIRRIYPKPAMPKASSSKKDGR